MTIKYRLSANITLPNITVEEVLQDGNLIGHRLTANEGYVMYETSENCTEKQVDPETGGIVEVPVNYYFCEATIPTTIPVENWTWVAVLESTVDENYIFGGGDNDHEVM